MSDLLHLCIWVVLCILLCVGLVCEVKYLLTPSIPEVREKLPLGKKSLTLMSWTDDKIVIQETWKKGGHDDEDE